MNEYVKKYGVTSLLISVALCVLAIFLIVKPEFSISLITFIVGIILLIIGIFHVVAYFKTAKEFRTFSMELIEGIAMAVFGIILVINPLVVTAIFLPICGIWVIVESIIRIQLALNIREVLQKRFIFVLLMAIATLIIGIVMVFNPFESAMMVATVVGILLLINEIINIIEAILILTIKE